MSRKDFILEDNGRIQVAVADLEHGRDMITMDKGWNRFHAEHGVGAMRYLNSNRQEELDSEIRLNMKADGYEPAIHRDKQYHIFL